MLIVGYNRITPLYDALDQAKMPMMPPVVASMLEATKFRRPYEAFAVESCEWQVRDLPAPRTLMAFAWWSCRRMHPYLIALYDHYNIYIAYGPSQYHTFPLQFHHVPVYYTRHIIHLLGKSPEMPDFRKENFLDLFTPLWGRSLPDGIRAEKGSDWDVTVIHKGGRFAIHNIYACPTPATGFWADLGAKAEIPLTPNAYLICCGEYVRLFNSKYHYIYSGEWRHAQGDIIYKKCPTGEERECSKGIASLGNHDMTPSSNVLFSEPFPYGGKEAVMAHVTGGTGIIDLDHPEHGAMQIELNPGHWLFAQAPGDGQPFTRAEVNYSD